MTFDLQRVFNLGYLGVIAQGRPSQTGRGKTCLYRAPDGAKCAIGHAIPDRHYHTSFENKRPAPGNPVAKALGNPNDHECIALMQLQDCHDFAADADDFLAEFKNRAAAFARAHNLTIPELADAPR